MKKILLASAYTVFLRRNLNLLLNWGFRLFSTTTGSEALRLHEEHRFDLIVADFKLEDMCGCTLCSLIRRDEQTGQVPIILTCHNIPGSIERVERSGASAMLIKPIAPITLVETIGNTLGVRLVRSKRVVLKVRVLSKMSDLEFFCFSHNISNSGILLETENHLAVGSRIVCQFSLAGSCRIETEGEISRSMTGLDGTYLYGVKFIDLNPESRSAIDNYILSMPFSGLREFNIKSSYINRSQNLHSPDNLSCQRKNSCLD